MGVAGDGGARKWRVLDEADNFGEGSGGGEHRSARVRWDAEAGREGMERSKGGRRGEEARYDLREGSEERNGRAE